MRGAGACLPLFSWGAALGMVHGGGGGSLVFSKRDGGVLGRRVKMRYLGKVEGCVVLHCPLSARLVFILSEGPIKHEKECEQGTLGTFEPLLKWLLLSRSVCCCSRCRIGIGQKSVKYSAVTLEMKFLPEVPQSKPPNLNLPATTLNDYL